MNKIELKRTWCDYLTPCPYKKNIMVGDYDCSQCEFHKENHQTNNKDYFDITSGYVLCNHPNTKEEMNEKIFGVYFAYNQIEVMGEYDKTKPYYSRDLARVAVYKNKTNQMEAYANTMCPASQLIEADTKEEFNQKVEELKDNFENEEWVKKNIEPYL